MKVTYKERHYLDRFRCVDRIVTRQYIKSFVSGDLVYFYENQFNIFTVEKNCIVEM